MYDVPIHDAHICDACVYIQCIHNASIYDACLYDAQIYDAHIIDARFNEPSIDDARSTGSSSSDMSKFCDERRGSPGRDGVVVVVGLRQAFYEVGISLKHFLYSGGMSFRSIALSDI